MTASFDRPNTRQMLDAVRPDSDDLQIPDLAEVARQVEQSEELRSVFKAQQAFDRQIGDVLRHVVVPAGLKGDLLRTLAASRRPLTPLASERTANRSRSRRAVLTTAAALLLGCITWLAWPSAPDVFTLDHVRAALPVSDGLLMWGRLDIFDGSFDARSPDSTWNECLEKPVKGIDLNHDGVHDAAVIPFVSRGERPTRGYLMMVQASAIADQPAVTRLTLSGISYVPVPNTAWKSRDAQFVYLCFVEEGRLESLYGQLYGSSV